MSEASKFLSNVPLFDVKVAVTSSCSSSSQSSVARTEIPVRMFGDGSAALHLPIITLPLDTECTLEVQFTSIRGNSQRANANTATVHDPKYHKPKEVSWWVVLGSLSTGELLVTKRTSISGRQQSTACVTVDFVTSNESIPDDMCLFILSDCLLGIDMKYAFTIQT